MMWLLICLAIFILVVAVLYILISTYKPQSLYELKNAHIAVTGGSSGIGKAIAIEAVKRGAKVTLIARNKQKLDEAKKEISAYNQSGKEVVHTESVDLSGDYGLIEKAIAGAEASLGPVDILVNNAGTSTPKRFDETPVSDFTRLMNINYMSAVQTTKAVVSGMKARGRGRIVFVSSVAGQMGVYGCTAYSATKFALRGLAEALAMELKPFNIAVTLNFPPDTDTPLLVEENKYKPKETLLISEAGGLIKADVVAKALLNDTVEGKFFSYIGFDGFIVTSMTSGFSPATSVSELLFQAFTMGLFRVVAIFYLFTFDRIIQKCKAEREKELESNTKKQS